MTHSQIYFIYHRNRSNGRKMKRTAIKRLGKIREGSNQMHDVSK